MEERRLAAEAADLEEEEFLQKWHLDVKKDFPIGPSRLKLDNSKLKGWRVLLGLGAMHLGLTFAC